MGYCQRHCDAVEPVKINWDNLLQRIKREPLKHLGGLSPRLLHSYFEGYSQALTFHGQPVIAGNVGLKEFNRWFMANAYSGPQGWASYCVLLTDTEEQALELFYEFRSIAKKAKWKDDDSFPPIALDVQMSVLDLIRSDAIRQRPAMYFGNSGWLSGIWAMWSGYVWAESDLGIGTSIDREMFVGFKDWLRKRFEFAQEANFGKLFEFLALNVKENALENFFDHLDLFLEGAPPDARTKRFLGFLDEAVASVLKDHGRQKN